MLLKTATDEYIKLSENTLIFYKYLKVSKLRD